MKKFISIIAFICFSTIILGQSGYLKLIESGKYSKVEKKIDKDLVKNPNDVELNYYKSRLLMEPEYKNYNPKLAYRLLVDTKALYRKITDDKEQKKLGKIPLDADVLNKYIDTVCIRALDDAIKLNTEDAYIDYLNYFSLMSTRCNKTATENRNKVAYASACDDNTAEAFQKFMTKYPNAEQYNLAKNKRNALEFNKAKELDKIENYKAFIAKYPDADEVKLAWERIHELAFEEAVKVNTAQYYQKFMTDYPKAQQYKQAYELMEDCQYYENVINGDWLCYYYFLMQFPNNRWKSVAQDSIYSIACRDQHVDALKYCVLNFVGGRKDNALLLLHDVITDDGEIATLNIFYDKYDDPIFDDIKIRDYEIANIGDKLLLHLPYSAQDFKKYDEYIKLAAPNEKSFVALQRLISQDIINKSWSSAISKIKVYESYFGANNEKISDLIGLLETKWDYSIKINSIGTGVNTTIGGEYSPVISIDDKSLYFCGKNRKDNVGGEDIFVSLKKSSIWNAASVVTDLSSAESNDAPLSISADGNTMLLFKSGKIFYSEKTLTGWNHARELPSVINAADWQSDAMITSDGKSLFFTSTGMAGQNTYRINPYNYHGDNQYPSDIFVSLQDDFGNWGKPINLGHSINTPYSERTPFLHPDMKTLYFSSDGHGGIGKLDVYKSTRLYDTCWTCWSDPINLGKEINTYDNDMGYKISTAGDVAYFSYEQKSSKQTSLLLLLDVSGSMDGYKLEELKKAAIQTCQSAILNNSEVAILAFAGDCMYPIISTMDFTKDINDVITSLYYLSASGGTPMYESYFTACQYLRKNSSSQSNNKVIMLMTDGDANGCTTLDKIMSDLRNYGLLYRTQCIAYDVDINSTAYSDLQKIATDSKGQFYFAGTSSDIGLTFEKAGSDIFNVSQTGGNTDIMMCNLPTHLRPDYVATIAGKLVDSDNKPVYADIRWEDLETGKNVGKSKSDPSDGSFFIVLPLGKIYGYYVDTDDYFPISNSIDLKDSLTAVEIDKNIDVVSFKQMIEDGTAVPVNNLFFSVAKSSLLPYSIPELKRVASIIKSKNLKVEISGHTDSDGEEDDNLKLSESRAQAVKDFLVNEGCDPNYMVIVGFGETKPIVSNDTEEGKAKNRRVELRFVE